MLTDTNNISKKGDSARLMDDLAAYGLARDVAKEKSQDGVFGFKDTSITYEIETGKPFALHDYGIDFSIVAPDDKEFNLIVRKDAPNSLHTMPKDKLRAVLMKIVESV